MEDKYNKKKKIQKSLKDKGMVYGWDAMKNDPYDNDYDYDNKSKRKPITSQWQSYNLIHTLIKPSKIILSPKSRKSKEIKKFSIPAVLLFDDGFPAIVEYQINDPNVYRKPIVVERCLLSNDVSIKVVSEDLTLEQKVYLDRVYPI